jgi:hypothetical protein
MSSIITKYKEALQESIVGVLSEVIAAHPKTSIVDLRNLVQEHPDLGPITLAEMFAFTGAQHWSPSWWPRASPLILTPNPSKDEPAEDDPVREWDTRTAPNRAELDRTVLECFKDDTPHSAGIIRARVGGTAKQIRASLNRLIAAGDLSFKGLASGTRYTRKLDD